MARYSVARLAFSALLVCAALLVAAAPGACGSTKVENRGTTVGQELKDLDDARNKGLLTEEEYHKQREQIMKRR